MTGVWRSSAVARRANSDRPRREKSSAPEGRRGSLRSTWTAAPSCGAPSAHRTEPAEEHDRPFPAADERPVSPGRDRLPA